MHLDDGIMQHHRGHHHHNNNTCNNCGKQGHVFHQCKQPITSFGMVVFRNSPQGIQYLMIRRKDSFGYIDFIRGKYLQNNLDHLKSMFNEMSVEERKEVSSQDFPTLWRRMWGQTHSLGQYKNEEHLSQKKFETLRKGTIINGEEVSLQTLIDGSSTSWSETEWEFPKGRRNFQEKELDCALREFEEETGYPRKEVIVIENLMPFEEIFVGSNHKSYKHKYFLGFMDSSTFSLSSRNFQQSEVSKMEWKTFEQCNDCIRPYNLEKKKLLSNINKVLLEYKLCPA